MMGKKQARKERLSRRRRRRPWYFRVVLILLPFFLLAVLEGIFRLGGVARTPSFLIEREVGLITYLQPNPDISTRFFPPSLAAVLPIPNFQVLPAKKSSGTRRILCLGASTTAGFPFPVHGSYPAVLRQILTEREPGVAWEVTNCGLTAISSASIADLIGEFLDTEPDALAIYMGHNEFYGAGGVASQGSGIVRYLSPLRRLRVARVIESLLSHSAGGAVPATLMERMVKRERVEPGSPLRGRAFQSFRRHLGRILDAADERGVPVVLCEVVSNERDHYPFGSSTAVAEDLGGIGMVAAKWPQGRPSLEVAGEMLDELDEEVARDSLHAGLRYLRGIVRWTLGDSGAAADLREARNLDVVPFRAPDAVNEILREEEKREHVTLVPVESIFRNASEDGIPGEELFVEHLHPTFLGNCRIASAIADALIGREAQAVTPADAGRWLRRSGLSRFDLAFADARIGRLHARWPYTRQGNQAPPFDYHAPSLQEEAVRLAEASGADSSALAYYGGGSAEEEAAVQALLNHQTDLLMAHANLARAAVARGDLYLAAHECHAAAELFPVDPSLWIELGEIRSQLGDREGAMQAARNALEWQPTAQRALDLLRRAETESTPD